MAIRGNRGGGGDRVLESRHVIGLFLLMLVFSGVFFALGYVMGRNQYDGQVRAESNPRATPDPVFQSKNDLAAMRKKNSQSSSAANSNSASSSNSSGSTGSGWGAVSSTPASNSRDSVSAPNATADDSATPSSDWSFYNSGKNAPDDRLKPAPTTPSATVAANPKPSALAASIQNPKATNVSANIPAKQSVGVNGSQVPAGSYVLQVAAMRQNADATAVANSLRLKHFPAFVINPTTDKYYHVQVGPYHDVKSADAAKKGLESAGFKAIVKH
jgi:cell division septation protein DedD